MAIAFFVPKNSFGTNKTGAQTGGSTTVAIQVTAHDIEIVKGQKIENFYTVSNENAKVSFDIERADLVQIEGDDITALRQGETNIKIIAQNGDEEDSCTIKVRISADKYATISALSNCSISENKIYAQGCACAIKIEFFDNYGEKASCDYELLCDDATVILKSYPTEVIIKSSHSFSFKIYFDAECEPQTIEFVVNSL